jgi:hypothetical protein
MGFVFSGLGVTHHAQVGRFSTTNAGISFAYFLMSWPIAW